MESYADVIANQPVVIDNVSKVSGISFLEDEASFILDKRQQ
jgi:hypothetical protein